MYSKTLTPYIVYSLLDPHLPNAHVALYIAGIPIAETILFAMVWGVIHLRDRILPRGRGVMVPQQIQGGALIQGL
jgi:hypothetical protein